MLDVAALLGISNMPSYVANRWYKFLKGPPISNLVSASASATTTYLTLAYMPRSVAVNQFGCAISSLNSQTTGKVAWAVYGYSTATGGPTGAPQFTSSAITATAVGPVLSGALGVTLSLGYFFIAMQCSTTYTFAAFDAQVDDAAELTGSVTFGSILPTTPGYTNFGGFVITGGTFGTWPTATTSNVNESTARNIPATIFQAFATG